MVRITLVTGRNAHVADVPKGAVMFPENGLHPTEQRLLRWADGAVIRTHSEYIIREAQVRTRRGEYAPGEIVILDWTEKGLSKVSILANGCLAEPLESGLLSVSAQQMADTLLG